MNVYGDLRRLSVYFRLFITVASPILFLVKVGMIVLTVMSGFSAIRIGHRLPVLASLYGFLSLISIIFYIAIFQLSYLITENGEDLRGVIEVKTSEALIRRNDQKYCRLFLKSMRPWEILVGGFYAVEREAVPIFIDFVSQQIVDLLITF